MFSNRVSLCTYKREVMGKLTTGVLFTCILTAACTSKTNKRMTEEMQQMPTKVETKTSFSYAAAKVNGLGDSAVFIRPMHKYKHQKKVIIK